MLLAASAIRAGRARIALYSAISSAVMAYDSIDGGNINASPCQTNQPVVKTIPALPTGGVCPGAKMNLRYSFILVASPPLSN